MLENWTIKFEDLSKDDPDQIILNDNYNLTGCINFYDIKIKNLDISSNMSGCEDAINFVRTSGNVNNLDISNSKSDALDADFSNLLFKNIEIKNSKNDCLDFSFGEYFISSSF